ncbi:unnamed protein product [Diamesa tonsa]
MILKILVTFIFIQMTFAARCQYKTAFGFYFCDLSGSMFINPTDNVISVGGHHEEKDDDSILHVELFNSTVHFIPNALFHKFKNMKSLYFHNARPITLDENSFSNCNNLTFLTLSENRIKRLPDGVFQECYNLQSIELIKNDISEVFKDTFKGLSRLIRLNLSGNNISVIYAEAFDSMPHLLILNLANNQLRKVHSTSLNRLVHLRILDATSNICINRIFVNINSVKVNVIPYFEMCFKNIDELIEKE